jgi:hypothetical protein
MNLYSYGNSPVTSVDPSGLTSISALGWAFGRGAAIGAITTLVAVGLVTFGGALGAGIVTTAAIAGAGIFVADASVRIITGRGYSATEASEMAGGLVAGGAITRGFRSRLHSETPEQMTLKQPCSDPIIGSKLDYAFGKATGRQHNITRSLENLRQLERIGLPDNASNRAYLQSHFESVYRDPRSIELRDGAFTTRISLLMGPEGGLRVKSIWVDPQLISMIFQGKGR